MTDNAPRRSAPPRTLVLVVGPYRSGTSLLAGILGLLGFHVPQPEVQADGSNPRGFGEPRWVVDFHTRLLRQRRVTVLDSRPSAWTATAEAANDEAVLDELSSWLAVHFVGAENVVVKDPRIGWFLPLWLRAAGTLDIDTSFVTMLRHPTEVVNSARTWYGEWQNDASRVAAWLNVTLQAEQATRGAPRAFVRYEDLLSNWRREISRSAELLDLPWLVGIETSRHPEIDAFVDPDLRRSGVGWGDLSVPPPLQAMAEQVWHQVSALADPGGDDEPAQASLDSERTRYLQFYADAEAVAQSSITAVKPRRGGSSGPAGGGGASRSHVRLRVRLARRIPVRYRKALRARATRPPKQTGDGTPLPLRIVGQVPMRYRERVPLPVQREAIRAGRWVSRTFRS
jgi:hypothetical protein